MKLQFQRATENFKIFLVAEQVNEELLHEIIQ